MGEAGFTGASGILIPFRIMNLIPSQLEAGVWLTINFTLQFCSIPAFVRVYGDGYSQGGRKGHAINGELTQLNTRQNWRSSSRLSDEGTEMREKGEKRNRKYCVRNRRKRNDT